MSRAKPLRWPSLRRTLIGIHDDLLSIHDFCPMDYGDSDLSELEMLVVALEDHRYFRHNGVDIISFGREFFSIMIGKRHGGASTIDMQFVRTVTGYQEYTIKRKIYEMLLALIIQQRYDKWTILRNYLRIAYLGHRIRGVDDASWIVFGKSAENLTQDEALEIASMFVYPRPSVEVPRWRLKLERRKSYGKTIYIRDKKRLEKLPRRKIFY